MNKDLLSNIAVNEAGYQTVKKTREWISQVIVGLNFCPFAKKELVNNSIYYYVTSQQKIKKALIEFKQQCQYLHAHPEIETSLLIFEQGFDDFQRYLDLVDYCNDIVIDEGFEGIFQIASFHPLYCFEGESFDDAANYTNRSPYPTLHLIREKSMEKVLTVYKNPEQIPEDNIKISREKGLLFFENILKRL
ncbi:DUF1415 domain-containing protein [Thalassotalea profundi]|uniref:DUF1415 domain-containing protein n=1 Tax=Thalassotalea profundi TaxID=2036687 RepID=A0ABQ3J352_9GAMM|nr:DUF1415 domain-containing protein [Thalassotalea profundi]GHF01161.1 DUF1415 domain-containing protein [Thalassotalea profundi]